MQVTDSSATQRLPLVPPPRAAPGYSTLAGRTVVITCVVALIAVVATALFAWPLAVQVTTTEARRALADRAEVVKAMLEPRRSGEVRKRAVAKLREQGVTVLLIVDGRPLQPRLVPPKIVKAIAVDRHSVSTSIRRGDNTFLVEGRPLGIRHGGFVLTQLLRPALSRPLLRRLAVALLVGLAAGSGAGYLLARRLAGPLRRAAYAARRLSDGDRDVVLPVAPPAEVAELTGALNELNRALASSEGRQRQFLMSVSHELRTPLTTIRGYAEALADDVLPPGAGADAGRTMLAEADRLDRLVADLLALARLQAQEFSVELMPVELTGVVHAAAVAWQPRCAEVGVELRTELGGPIGAYTDSGRIRQVLDILVENAMRLVPAGAPIVLAVRGEPHDAVAEVRDGGPGLTDSDLAVAFDQGALHERYKDVRRVGTGLGLALAAGLVTRLGGRIEAGHAPEGGARFTVRLPPPPS
ncbi:MAG: sensor histidine kinase [Micromonosporaceae bacterium]